MENRIDYSFVEKCIENRICFAAYTLPNHTEFSMILQRSAYPIKFNATDNYSNYKGFILAPFDSTINDKFLIADDFILVENEVNVDAWDFIKTTLPNKKYFHELPLATPHVTYLQQFDDFISDLTNRRAKKLVLSRVITSYKKEHVSYAELFKILNATYPNTFNYLFYTPNSGLWMGATPEQLLRINREEATTVALAGTQSLRNIELNKYVWGDKEREEQQFVVDHVEKTIRKYTLDEKINKSTQTIKAAKAVHLETSFRFNTHLISERLTEFLDDLHPTPAVCGVPKSSALKLINETEHHDREFYSGFLGPLHIHQKTDLFVNLRCLKAEGNNLSLFVGGGITLSSKAQSEWDETALKAQTLLSLIN